MNKDDFRHLTDAELEKFNDLMTQANTILKDACARKAADRFANEAYVQTMMMQIGSFEQIRARYTA